MKIKTCLALPVLLMLPIAATAQGPIDGRIYGKININVELEDPASGDSSTDIVSNASRLGFAGETTLSEGLEVIYQLEYEVHLDDGDKDGRTFTQRNSFLGLRGKYGTVKVGKHDTPNKMIQNDIDLFNDQIGDIKNVLDGENRENDILMYTSPTFDGFTVDIATIAGSGDSDLTSSISAAVNYSNDSFFAGFGVDDNVAGRDVVRFVGQYFVGSLALGLLYERSEPSQVSGADDEDALFFSVAYEVNKFTWKFQYGSSDQKAPGKEQLTTGFDYSLGSRTKLFTYFTAFDEDNSAKEVNYWGLGVEHRF